jgi:polyhydroxybutyrate depolymerase
MTVDVGGRSRSSLLFVPPGHDVDEPAPLVIKLHGAPSSPEIQVVQSNLNRTASEEGIVVVHPAAVDGVWDFEDGGGMDADVNDVEFISAVIGQVSPIVTIDPDRVYAIGFSQGAGFSAFLACHMPEQIAAVVAVAALMCVDGPACPQPQPTRVMGIVGAADPITTRGTGDLPFVDLPGPILEEAKAWAATNGCDPTPEEEASPGDVTRIRYSCGDDAALLVYIHPGGHAWPAEISTGIDTNTIIWEFLGQYVGPVTSGWRAVESGCRHKHAPAPDPVADTGTP